jgi:hypothetical protein
MRVSSALCHANFEVFFPGEEGVSAFRWWLKAH